MLPSIHIPQVEELPDQRNQVKLEQTFEDSSPVNRRLTEIGRRRNRRKENPVEIHPGIGNPLLWVCAVHCTVHNVMYIVLYIVQRTRFMVWGAGGSLLLVSFAPILPLRETHHLAAPMSMSFKILHLRQWYIFMNCPVILTVEFSVSTVNTQTHGIDGEGCDCLYYPLNIDTNYMGALRRVLLPS